MPQRRALLRESAYPVVPAATAMLIAIAASLLVSVLQPHSSHHHDAPLWIVALLILIASQ